MKISKTRLIKFARKWEYDQVLLSVGILFIPGLVFVAEGQPFWMGLLVGVFLLMISCVIYYVMDLHPKKQGSKKSNS